MKREDKRIILIFVRYLLLAFLSLFIYSNYFYKALLFLTSFLIKSIFSIFYRTIWDSKFIYIQDLKIEIIPACLGISAFFLLIILNFTTPMNIKKRIYILILSFVSLFLFNILRIVTLIIILLNKNDFFEAVHKFSWYFLSTLFVILLWFFTNKIFKSKDIPIYIDFKEVFAKIKNVG
jgi:exosortase/archaeosortase family protein